MVPIQRQKWTPKRQSPPSEESELRRYCRLARSVSRSTCVQVPAALTPDAQNFARRPTPYVLPLDWLEILSYM
jgi:hypothetical protein